MLLFCFKIADFYCEKKESSWIKKLDKEGYGNEYKNQNVLCGEEQFLIQYHLIENTKEKFRYEYTCCDLEWPCITSRHKTFSQVRCGDNNFLKSFQYPYAKIIGGYSHDRCITSTKGSC